MRLRLATAVVVAALAAPAAAAGEPGVEELRLENGLTVLLRPGIGAGQVALVVLYSIGSDHDPIDACGTAHLLEHLYATAAAGTAPARTAEEFFARYGRNANAQTGDDYTVFAGVFPKDRLAAEIEDAAARMSELRIKATDLEREVPRVLDELANMHAGIPFLAAVNLAREAARDHPCRRRGGDEEMVRGLSVETLTARWTRFYRPRNALLVLAGDLDVGDVERRIRDAFGTIPAGEAAPARVLPNLSVGSPPQPRLRRVSIEAPATASPIVAVAITVPAPGPAAAVPLLAAFRAWDVLRGERGRDRNPMLEGPSYPFLYSPLDGPDVLSFTTAVRKGESAEKALARLDEIVRRATDPLEPTERKRLLRTFGDDFGLVDDSLPAILLPLRGRPSTDPYGTAFKLGRRRQLGIDPKSMKQAFEAVTDTDLSRFRTQALQAPAVLVTPAK